MFIRHLPPLEKLRYQTESFQLLSNNLTLIDSKKIGPIILTRV